MAKSGLLGNFLTYSIGNILQSALTFLLLPIFLRFFSPGEYGVISVLTVALSFFSLFISGGAINGLVRIYFDVAASRRRELVGNTLIWYFLSALVGAALLWSSSSLLGRIFFHTDTHDSTIRMLGVVFFLSLLQSVPMYVFRLEKKAALYVSFSLFSFVLDFSLKMLFIVLWGKGVPGYFASSAISSGVTLALIVPFFRSYARFSLDLPFLKQLLRLGVPFIVSGIAMWTLDVSDRLLLSHFQGNRAVGIYSLAYNFANIFGIVLATPVALLVDPFFFSRAAERTEDDNKRLLERMVKYYSLSGVVLYLVISLGSGDILRILTRYFGAQPTYLDSIGLIPIITLAPLLYFITSQAGLAGLLVKRPEIVSTACLAAAVFNFTVNLVVIPRFGVIGAAATTVAAYFLFLVLAYWSIDRYYPVRYQWTPVGVIFLNGTCAFIAGSFIHLDHPVASLVLKVSGGVLVFLSMTFFSRTILSSDERRAIASYLTGRRG